jgi:hypothetical protein
LIDAEGREVGRLIGPAEWDSPEMVAFLETQISPEQARRRELGAIRRWKQGGHAMSHPRQSASLAVAGRTTTGLWNAIRARPRTTLVVLALLIVTAGAAMNWSALVAAGIAPLLISALPCAVMCALGLCMSRMGRSPAAAETAPERPIVAAPERTRISSVAAASQPSHLSADRIDAAAAVSAGLPPEHQERRPTHA